MDRIKFRRRSVMMYCLDPILEEGNVNQNETYGNATKTKPIKRPTKPKQKYDQKPRKPDQKYKKLDQNGRVKRTKSDVRCTSHLIYSSSTLPRMPTEENAKIPEKKELETSNPADQTRSSSLLKLPIVNHNQTVLALTKNVITEMLNVESVIPMTSQLEFMDHELQLELMGMKDNDERNEKFVQWLQENDFEMDDLIDIVRSNKCHYPLAEYLDVHHQLLKTVNEIHQTNKTKNEEDIGEEFGTDCAITQLESSYWDSETCESIPLSETKNLTVPLKEAFDQKAKRERHRHSFYETMTLNHWNAKLNENIIPVIQIDLYNQKLGLEGAKVIANLLLKYSCIRELSLAKNEIDIHGFSRICRSLASNHGLAKLDVRLNPLGDSGADHISRALRVNKSLRILNLASTGITGNGINFLVNALVKNTSLTDLDVGFNDLGETNSNELSQVLKQNIYLKRLRIRHTNMTQETFRTIFDALKTNSRIGILDISRNDLGDHGARYLSDMLVSNRSLTELNIEKCGVQTDGVTEIARALKANTTLKSLDMSMNELRCIGASALGEALKYNRSIQSLCLNMCRIKNDGFLSLLSAFDDNKTLKTLKVCFNHIGFQEKVEDATEYYRILGVIEEKYKFLLDAREDVKILIWGNRLEDALRIRKNGRYTTL